MNLIDCQDAGCLEELIKQLEDERDYWRNAAKHLMAMFAQGAARLAETRRSARVRSRSNWFHHRPSAG